MQYIASAFRLYLVIRKLQEKTDFRLGNHEIGNIEKLVGLAIFFDFQSQRRNVSKIYIYIYYISIYIHISELLGFITFIFLEQCCVSC